MNLHLEIPGLPPINSADGLNRWTRRRMRDQWHRFIAVAVRAELGRWPDFRPAAIAAGFPLDRAWVQITRCSAREPDFDGLVQGGKFLLDGLVKAGVIVDDKPSVIGQPVYRWKRAPRRAGCVWIDVWSVGADERGVEIGERVGAME